MNKHVQLRTYIHLIDCQSMFDLVHLQLTQRARIENDNRTESN
jgi:hypothetical protein